MSPRELGAYLTDVRDACRNVEDFARGLTLERYREDLFLRSAVERQLMIAGEAVSHVRRLDLSMANRLGPCDGIVAFRNILVHGYYLVNHEVVWNIIVVDVPRLRAAAQAALEAS